MQTPPPTTAKNASQTYPNDINSERKPVKPPSNTIPRVYNREFYNVYPGPMVEEMGRNLGPSTSNSLRKEEDINNNN